MEIHAKEFLGWVRKHQEMRPSVRGSRRYPYIQTDKLVLFFLNKIHEEVSNVNSNAKSS